MVVLKMKLRPTLKSTLIIVGWAFGIAVFILKAYFENPLAFTYYYFLNPVYSGLSMLNLLAILVISVVAGILLAKPEPVLIGCAFSLTLACVIEFVVLSLPAFPVEGEIVRELMFFRSISIVFKMMVPTVIVIDVIGGLVGGILGERLGMR